ncbi:hypothetical protein [Hyalangium rubrum]|uniref:Immunity protein 52 domain-containing protein n=1 Tax=Hyalangium rubrum TaxID=3103134 RepID=A0ABU5GVD8_9BACT|nr:hypothetical protein [Hyalangium sp. s54d21]MDY7225140.1 hypothetical protein [Hyalangium sp. s54d21]
MKHVTTYITFPPGVPSGAVVREILQRAFETYRWFRPMKYGQASLDGRLDPDRIDFDALVNLYERKSNLTVTTRTDRDYLILYPAKPIDPPYTGKLIWATSAAEASKAAWRSNHLQQVLTLMRLVGSPLAQAGLDADYERKKWRLVPDPDGLAATEVYTVRDYSEGLVGLTWRNFLGPPFVRLFGERLASLPSETRQELGDDTVLIQPYALPAQAGTSEATARERQLIAHLGPECFYDHEHHRKPTRLPELPSPPA